MNFSVVAMAVFLLPSCHSTKRASELPEVSGFGAEPIERGEGYVRRAYTRGSARISVTLAGMPMTDDGWRSWVQNSGSYPRADVGLPESQACGFYACNGTGDAERCDLHLQLRAGWHVELFGNGTARRADLDALVAGLPLASWVNTNPHNP
ncbi:MAG: hypothetical protein JST54_21960 [Deltaproteobacteria bacterium]|nr:hypothetical protein [Deltaproteobacteria bacterium]